MDGHLSWGILGESRRKGPWTAEEDKLLIQYISVHGEGRWNSVARFAGLKRNGKSCRLRWLNYLRPDLKRGQITPHEENIILELHARWGNRWSTIARSLPGRTDNEIKNYWRTHFKNKPKISSESSEKSKIHLSKHQHFQQQQQQKKKQQKQVDMRRIVNMSTLDESTDNRVSSLYQVRQEMVSMYPNTSEEQFIWTSMLNCDASAPKSSSENILWGGLWNLDDIHANLEISCTTSKATVPNLFTPFC